MKSKMIIAFSPDVNEFFFTVGGQKYSSCKIFAPRPSLPALKRTQDRAH